MKYMNQAIDLAIKNVEAGIGGPFGAVIVKDGQVLASASNSVTATNDPTAHAEVNAIRMACKSLGSFDLTGAELYTSCEPCPMCLAACYWAHISRIYFSATAKDAEEAGFNDAFIYTEFSKPFDDRSIEMVHTPIGNASSPFKGWAESNQKVEY